MKILDTYDFTILTSVIIGYGFAMYVREWAFLAIVLSISYTGLKLGEYFENKKEETPLK